MTIRDADSGRRAIFWWWVGAIWIAGLVWRIAYVVWIRPRLEPTGDASYYHAAARTLIEGHGFTKADTHFWTGYVPAADHPPAYTVLLAAGRLAGLTTMRQSIVLTCVVGSLQIPILAAAGRLLAGRAAGVATALMAAAYVNLWVWDTLLLSEPVALVFVAAFAWAVLRSEHDSRIRWVALAGAFLGLATLGRAELVAGAACFPLLAWRCRASGWLIVGRRTAAGVGAMVVVLAPWVGHNLARFNNPVFISNGLGTALVASTCASTFSGEFIGYADFRCYDRAGTVFEPGLDDSDYDLIGRRIAQEFAMDHLGDLPRVAAARLGRTLGWFRPVQQAQIEESVELRGPRWVVWAGIIQWQALLPLAVAGGILAARAGRPVAVFGFLVGLSLLAVTLTFGSSRYRASFEPLVVLFAGLAVAAVGRRCLEVWRAEPAQVREAS